MSDIHDCVAAFADGEPVDPELLDRALADADGRAYLIDVLVLRGMYGRRAPGTLLPDVPEALQKRTRLRWISAAAAIVLMSVLGGYVAGRQSAPRSIGEVPSAPRQVQSGVPMAAPAPTQIIRLEPGVDWTERGGGD